MTALPFENDGTSFRYERSSAFIVSMFEESKIGKASLEIVNHIRKSYSL
jgi:hypothetical protein